MRRILSIMIALSLLLLSANCIAAVKEIGHREIIIYGMIMHTDVLELKKIINESKHAKYWTIELHSPGGHTSAGIFIFNVLRELSKNGVEITTVVRGEASSMAAIIFLAGDKRIAYEGAQIMYHKAWLSNQFGQKVTPPEDSDAGKSLSMTNSFMVTVLRKYFNNDDKKINEVLTKETRYSAKELHDLGIATEYRNLTE